MDLLYVNDDIAHVTAVLKRTFAKLEDDWISPFNGFQYKVTPTKNTWPASRVTCRNWGGDIITVGYTDNITRNVIRRGLGISATSTANTYYIGLNGRSNDGNYVWTNGELYPSNGSLWWPNFPSSNGNCAVTYLQSNGRFWNVACGGAYQAICEKPT